MHSPGFLQNLVAARHFCGAQRHGHGGGVLVDGLYRDPYAEAFGGMVSGSNPSFEALSGALSGIARGAAVSIKGKAYTVVRIDPAREGMTLLELEQQ